MILTKRFKTDFEPLLIEFQGLIKFLLSVVDDCNILVAGSKIWMLLTKSFYIDFKAFVVVIECSVIIPQRIIHTAYVVVTICCVRMILTDRPQSYGKTSLKAFQG